jgi:hypothetical protein
MGLTAHPVAGKQKSADICWAFLDGCPDKRAVGAVFYGVNHTNLDAWRKVQAAGLPFYYIDNSFFDAVRGQQFRIAKNAVQMRVGDQQTDGKRFAALGLVPREWQDVGPGAHWVVCPQSEAFMRDIIGVKHDWLRYYYALGTARPLRIRAWDRDKTRASGTLQDDLEGAWGLVTHSSAAAVEALLHGVCPIVSKHSAVHGLAYRAALSAEGDDRLRAFGVLADNQWTLDEIREGKAWQWLNRK